jgi:hypothetical protein
MPTARSPSRGERSRLAPAVAAAIVLLGLSLPPSLRAGDPPPCEILSVTSHQDPDGLARDLPSSLSLWSLLETVEPAAVLDRIDGAGLHLGEPGRFSMRGASWTRNDFVLDGASLTDPARGGTPVWMADLEPLEAVDVTSSLAPVEDAAPGVTLSLRPRAPGGSWRGLAQAYGLGAGLQSGGREPPFPVARFGSLADASAVARGPLSGEKLGAVASARVARVSRLEGGDSTPLDARLVSGTLAVTYAPGERDLVHLLAAGQAIARPSPARARSTADPREDVHALGAVLRWSRPGSGGGASAYAGLWSGRVSSGSARLDPSLPVERLRDGPVPDLVLPASSDRSTFTAGTSLSPRGGRALGLLHSPRVGLEVRRAWTTDQPGPDSEVPETVDGLPARVWDYRSPGSASRRHVLGLSAWAADRLSWGDRLLVEAGLRFERTTGAASGAAQGVSWTTVVPRVAARLRLSDAGRVSLFGGLAEYQHRLLLDTLAFGDPNAPQASVYRWADANGDGRYQREERGVLVARAGPGAARDGAVSGIDPALRPPRTRELVAGIRASPGAGVVVTLVGIDRRERDLLESVNVGVTADDYVVRYLPDPGGDIAGSQDDQLLPVYDRRPESFGLDRFVLTNPPGGTSRYQGLEVRVEKAAGERFLFQAGATASRTDLAGTSRGFRVTENDQGLPGEIYDDPNADTYARGRGFFDRAFTVKLAGAWRGPGDLRLGLVARYQDGQPFARMVVVPDLAQGPEAVAATTRGQTFGRVVNTDLEGRPLTAEGHRFTYTLTVDARIEKGFRLGAHRLGLVAEAFNLLGTANEVEEDPVWGPAFREPVLVQPPRVLRLGARFDF